MPHSYCTKELSKPVSVRWTCSACGKANAADLAVCAKGQAENRWFVPREETEAKAYAAAAAHLAEKIGWLRERQDSYGRYSRLHLYTGCSGCGHREVWAAKRPEFSRIHPVISALLLILFCVTALPVIAAGLMAGAMFLFAGTGYAPAALIYGVAALWACFAAALTWFLIHRMRKNRALRALPDTAFPILAEEEEKPEDEAEERLRRTRARAEQSGASIWDRLNG